MLHAHMSGSSRDCDGTYSHGQDIPSREGEDDLAFTERMFCSLYATPDPYGGPVNIIVNHDSQGRLRLTMERGTDEGYEAREVTICEKDDYDPDYSGFRDHTAERMGY